MNNKKIAFVIHNMVLYHTIKNLYVELIKRDFEVSIFIADNIDQTDWLLMADETYNHLTGQNVNLFKSTEYSGEEFDIAFYPYLPYQFEINSKINIRYQYGMAKPVWNFKAETLLFDYCLCYGNYDFSFLRHYCQTKIVGNLKYAHLSDLVIENNKLNYIMGNSVNVLYLPTYGKESSFDLIINDVLALPQDWQINIKLHHGTEFLEYERKKQIMELPNVSVYGQNDLLEDLLMDCDIVISDGSSACFDAIYFCKPLILAGEYFGDDFYGEEPITKQLFTKYGIEKYEHSSHNLSDKIMTVLADNSYVNLIHQLRDYFFPVRGEKTLELVVSFINDLNNKGITGYNATRQAINAYLNVLLSNSAQLSNVNVELNNVLNKLNDTCNELELTRIELNNTSHDLISYKDRLEFIYNTKTYKIYQTWKKLIKIFCNKHN